SNNASAPAVGKNMITVSSIVTNSAISTQRSALSTQHSAISDQRSALSSQHSALSDQHSAINASLFTLHFQPYSLKIKYPMITTPPSTTITTYWRASPDCTNLAARPIQAVSSPVPFTRPSMIRTSITFHSTDIDSVFTGRTTAAS